MKQETPKKSAKNNIIEDWLKEHGDPEIDKEVECKLEQITLEQAAERFYPLSKGGSMWMPSADDCNKANKQEGFIEGAKWQAERMYSEEDMKQFAWECVANFLSNNVNEVEMALVEVIIDRNSKQFEQFKKK